MQEELGVRLKVRQGTFLAVQWLRLLASTTGGAGSIPGWGTKIPHAAQCGQKEKKKKKESEARGAFGPSKQCVQRP